MKCPSCGAAYDDGAAPECPACGLIFAKWRERQEKEKLEALAALQTFETAPQPAPNPWRRRVIAGAVVAAWLLILSYFVTRRPRAARAPVGQDTGAFVEMRDPKTGDMRRMPVRVLGVPSAQGDVKQ